MKDGKKRPAELEPLVLLEDEPVPGHGVDDLSLVPFAKVVAGAAVGTRGPFTIGVFADWGQGKTSVLRQAKSLVEADPASDHVATVWFNAWQFEKEEHPIVPLVASIVAAVEAQRERPGVGEQVKAGFATIARALRAVAYGFSAKAKVKVPGFAEIESGFVAKEMIERYEKLRPTADPLLDKSLYYRAFDTLAKVAQAGGRKPGEPVPKVMVFIDDLDRCLPDQGLKLLESIKLVLAQPGFIFALAVDRRILEGYLRNRYKNEFGVEDYEASGTSYLDKIVQLPLPLPSHRGRFESYVRGLLNRDTFKAKANKPVKKALVGLVEILAVGSNYNPRSLVRFVNNLIVDRSLWTSLGQPVDAVRLGLCAVARILQGHLGDSLYRRLVDDKRLCEDLAKGGEGIETRRKRWEDRERLDPIQRREQDLLQRLREAQFLTDFLSTAAGKVWLTDHDARREVDEFLVVQWEEVERSQKEIVEKAIRSALGKEVGDLSQEDLKELAVLDFDFLKLTDTGLGLLQKIENLQVLSLAGTGVTDAGLVHLKKFQNLEWLDLFGTEVTDVGLEHLETLRNLQSLFLSDTGVTDAGLEYLKPLSNLQELSLDDTTVTDAGLNHVENLSLRWLSLDGTHITNKGLEQLKKFSNLEELSLSGTKVTDAGFDQLSRLTKLQRLMLDSNKVTDAGLEQLTGLLDLQYLSLVDTEVTQKGVENLRKSLPNCKVSL